MYKRKDSQTQIVRSFKANRIYYFFDSKGLDGNNYRMQIS